MTLGSTIKIIRQTTFLTQEEFAQKINVAPSTINRWELNKVRPNVKTMKKIKKFCIENNLPYDKVEKAWICTMVLEGNT